MSKDLKMYLDRNLQQIMTVHSVFTSAINVIDHQGNLVTLLFDMKSIGPMTAILSVSQREINSIQPEDKVLIVKNGLLFQRNNLFLSTHNVEIWDQGVQIHGKSNNLKTQQEQLNSLRQVIVGEEASIGICGLIQLLDFSDLDNWILPKKEQYNPYCDFIFSPLTKLLEALIAGDHEKFLTLLPKFIGFGPGLTPSTDDFLAGIMMSLYYETAVNAGDLEVVKKHLGDIYRAAQGRTTIISENMLKLASCGYVSEDYRALVRGVFFKTDESMDKLAQTVIKHGASSGTDFLFGFYCMTQINVTKSVKEALKNDSMQCTQEYLL